MISAGIEGRLPYMTYSEPWSRNPPKQPAEVFLRPAPKLLPTTAPPVNRCTQEQTIFIPYRSYNNGGVPATTYPNGTRIAPSRPISKYLSPPPSAIPVNLTQKEETIKEEPLSPYSHYRLFPHSQFSPFPYPALCQPQYLLRTPTFPPTPLSPQELFSPGTPTSSATFLSPPATFSPPTSKRCVDKQSSPIIAVPSSPLPPQSPNFKVPSGKEGSMKHRLLIDQRSMPLDLQKPPEGRRRLGATTIHSPPRSPKQRHLNNNSVPGNFQKGQLIQMANGEFKRIEDMRTEDFIQSADRSPALRLAESTVVKIEDGTSKEDNVTITLTYDQRRAQVEVDSTPDHPYFVMGHGWASCNPDRTVQLFGLKVHRLQVGDVLVSLTPREPAPASSTTTTRSTTIMTTATTTAMTSRQYSGQSSCFVPPQTSSPQQQQQHRPLSLSPPKGVRSPDYPQINYYGTQVAPLQLDAESRKRRWSAPDTIEDEEPARRSSRTE